MLSAHLVRSLIFKAPNLSAHLSREKKNLITCTYSNCFLFYSSIRGASFFLISSIILSFEFWNIIFAIISKPPCPRSEEYLFEPVISHLILLACLTKTCVSLDINFGRWPTVTDSLVIYAIAYLSWTKYCGSSLCLADKTRPIGASQNDLKNMISTNTAIHSKNKFFFKENLYFFF